MSFFNMLEANSDNLYILIPLSTNSGIFVGLGAKATFKWLWMSLCTLLLKLVAGLHYIIRGEDPPELPFHISST